MHYTASADLGSMFSIKDLRLDAHKLAHLEPGLVHETVHSTVRGYGMNLQTAQVLKPGNRSAAERAVQAGGSLGGTYRIQAYTDLAYMGHANPGTTCSGFVYWAWARSGAGHISPVHYSANFRRSAGEQLYAMIYALVMDLGVPWLPDAWTARRIAHQITNCFLDRGCNQADAIWRSNPGTGDGACAPNQEDCGVCPQDCPCPAGTHCEGRQCIDESTPLPCDYVGACEGLPSGYCDNRCNCTCTATVCDCLPPGPYCQVVCEDVDVNICACP